MSSESQGPMSSQPQGQSGSDPNEPPVIKKRKKSGYPMHPSPKKDARDRIGSIQAIMADKKAFEGMKFRAACANQTI